MRTPLNGMLGYGELLRDMSDSLSQNEIKECGYCIHSNAMRLLRLIQNYLLFTEFELNTIKVNRSRIIEKPELNCKSVCFDVAKKYGRVEDLDMVISDGSINIQEYIFQKIVEEMLDNAFKYYQMGTTVCKQMNVYEDFFKVTIIDKGSGINKATIKKIGAYVQFDRKMYELQGIGFGLILVRKLVNLYHGTFQIDSEVNNGTIVSCTIPIFA